MAVLQAVVASKIKVPGATGKNNSLFATDDSSILKGLNGDDALFGGLGDDDLFGGSGRDTLDGGGGINVMNGGNGNDMFVLDAGIAGFDTITDFQGPMPAGRAVRQFTDTLQINGAGGQSVVLVQNGTTVDVYVGVVKIAELLNANAEMVLGQTEFGDEPASFEVGDVPVEENHAPTANPFDTEVNEESGIVRGDFAKSADDTDGDPLTFSEVSGSTMRDLDDATPGLTINEDGTFAIDSNDPALTALTNEQSQTFVAHYRVEDGRGGSAESTFSYTVYGVNHAPYAGAASALVYEDTGVFESTLVEDSSDPDGDTLTYSEVSGMIFKSVAEDTTPGLKISANGDVFINTGDAAFDDIADGETRDYVAYYQVDDGHGGTDINTYTYTVTGEPDPNDAPVTPYVGVNVDEGSGPHSGTLLDNVTDDKLLSELTFAFFANEGSFDGVTFGTDGSWEIDTDHLQYNYLSVGTQFYQSFNYEVTDAQGATSGGTLSFVISGTNDAPVTEGQSVDATEDTDFQYGNLALVSSDPEGDNLTFGTSDGVAGFTLHSDGEWSFDTSASAYDYLNDGDTTQVVVEYFADDGLGGYANGTLTINLSGVTDELPNQAPSFIFENNFFNLSSMAPFQVDLKTLVSDPDTDIQDLVFSIESGLLDDEITLDANGILTFYPALDEFYQDRGGDSFQFRVTDASGGFDIGSIYFDALIT